MLARNRRLAIAGVIAAAAIAVPTAAFASASGSPSATPTPPACAGPGKSAAPGESAAPGKSPAPSQLPQMAAAAGISADRLQAALIAMKRAGGDTPAGVAAFAGSAGVTNATAQQIVDQVSGPLPDQTGRK
jgi:hypothetical protein